MKIQVFQRQFLKWQLIAIFVVGMVFQLLFDGGNVPQDLPTTTKNESTICTVAYLFKEDIPSNLIELRGGVLPGASGLPITPSKPMSPHGQPRVNRGAGLSPTLPQHVPGTNVGKYNPNGTLRTGGPSKSVPPGCPGSGRSSTGLAAKKNANSGSQKLTQREQGKAQHAESKNLKKTQILQEHQDFLARMRKKGYTEDISAERFLELCENPQTKTFDNKSLSETTGGLQFELSGQIKNLRRPENPKVDLDFMAEQTSSGKTIYIDHKRMIDFQSLRDKGIDISKFPSHESVAFNMGKNSIKQKTKFIGLDKGPTSREDVVHLFNFEAMYDRDKVPVLMQAVLNGAEQQGCVDNLIFINYD
jgi:hypothetical protein